MKRYDSELFARARALREERKPIGYIAKQVGVSVGTVFDWVKDMQIVIPHSGGKNGGHISDEVRKKMADSWRKASANKRKVFYDKGKAEAYELLSDRKVRDFVCLYWAEGYKRSRNSVSVVNTDPKIICLCARVISKYAGQKVWYRLFCSEEEKDKLLVFWSEILKIETDKIRFQLKKQVSKRRAEYGLLAVGTNDTHFRSRLQAWMDKVREDW